MKVIALIALIMVVSGCQTLDVRKERAYVVSQLSRQYDLSEVNHNVGIIVLDEVSGYFNDGGPKIVLKTANRHHLQHELIHFYLWRLNIPSTEHHHIMKSMQLY